jgi:hypothetical protein
MSKNKKLYVKNEGGNSSTNRGDLKHPRYKYERHKKRTQLETIEELQHKPIIKRYREFYKTSKRWYHPLYHFLLKNVGKNWKDVFQDVFPKVDGDIKAIQKMVLNLNEHGSRIKNFDKESVLPYFKDSHSYYSYRYFSTLYVDENDVLQYVDKNFRLKKPLCTTSTYSFNGSII